MMLKAAKYDELIKETSIKVQKGAPKMEDRVNKETSNIATTLKIDNHIG